MTEKNEAENTNFVCSCCDKDCTGEQHSTVDGVVCDGCFEDNYTTCERCDKSHNMDNMVETVNGGYVCSSCADSYYHECYHCGRFVHMYDVRTYDDNNYCQSCYDDLNIDDYDEIPLREYINTNKYISQESGKIVKSCRKFGVEIETYNEDLDDAVKIIKQIPKEIGMEHDGSIEGDNGVEFQTPPASGKGAEELIGELCKGLSDCNYLVDSSCGYHIHVDCEDVINPIIDQKSLLERDWYGNIFKTEEEEKERIKRAVLKKIFLFYLCFEDVIMSFLPKTRRNNSYCKPLKPDYHFEEIWNAETSGDVERIWYRVRTKCDIDRCKEDHKHDSRYRGINIHSLLAMNHIEIRFHSGTISREKILQWANLHTTIIDKMLVDNVFCYKDDIRENFNEIDLNTKTKAFFSLLGLDKSCEDYFRSRQLLFIEQQEYKIAKKSLSNTTELMEDEEEE